MSHQCPRAFCRAELVAVLFAIAVCVSIISVVTAQADGKPKATLKTLTMQTKDATQLRLIHQSWVVFGREFNGIFPRPGLIDRLPHEGREIPGRGPEDKTANTTAHLYSALVMQNYFTPDILISPVERNPKVKSRQEEYDYQAYQPVHDVYWDSGFKADLAEVSHVSYAHLPIHGARADKYWRDSMDSHFAVIGNRGPKDGLMNAESFTCGPHGNWAGNICFSDNHGEFFTDTVWTNETEGVKTSDNFFAIEGDLDMILAFTRNITDKGPELQFD